LAVSLLAMPRRGTSRVIAGVDRLVRDRMVSRAEDYLVSGELSSSGSRLNEAARCAEAVLDRLEVRRLKAA
jgi:hypothetical protein